MVLLEEHGMARKRYSDEDCLKISRQVEVELAAGADVATACRLAGISDAALRREVLNGEWFATTRQAQQSSINGDASTSAHHNTHLSM